jgi:alpha/beta superfamily hydrolase
MSSAIFIDGPEGRLEARLDASAAPAKLAILCHPHPLYGGDMHDRVLGILADALIRRDVATVRFNFRGVGASEGQFSGAGGEVDDLIAVIRWVRETYPEIPLTLGGYSFGAATVLSALAGSGATRALLIALPAGRLSVTEPDGSIPVDVFAGDEDELLDLSALTKVPHLRVHRIDGADHFFTGRWEALRAVIDEVV